MSIQNSLLIITIFKVLIVIVFFVVIILIFITVIIVRYLIVQLLVYLPILISRTLFKTGAAILNNENFLRLIIDIDMIVRSV
mmetsp:Transcript_6272/g.8039  ORF Transcript_6272/g.8039 Transcript_6272/m.8039 type:complete len:82 (-) Transcript_6272:385-630(-)